MHLSFYGFDYNFLLLNSTFKIFELRNKETLLIPNLGTKR